MENIMIDNVKNIIIDSIKCSNEKELDAVLELLDSKGFRWINEDSVRDSSISKGLSFFCTKYIYINIRKYKYISWSNYSPFKTPTEFKEFINRFNKNKNMNILEAIKSGREVQTKDGRKVRILATDFEDKNYPIVAEVHHLGIEGCDLFKYTKDGKFDKDIIYHVFDLVVKPKKVTKWINVYKCNDEITIGGCTFDSKEEASTKGETSSFYICTKSIEIEL